MRLILELGSGWKPTLIPGARVIHLDRVEGEHVEIVADLAHGIPLPSNVFDEVLAYDILEHLHNIVAAMDEMHRVLKPAGLATIRVPVFGSPNHYLDVTHLHGFQLGSFDHFDDKCGRGKTNGRTYTKRRWYIAQEGIEDDNIVITMWALKPGEVPRKCPELFGALEPEPNPMSSLRVEL
jgi:SAM-dependent methyltransferase